MRTSAVLVVLLLASCGGESKPSKVDPPPDEAQAFVEGKDYLVVERVRFMDEQGFEAPAEAFSVLLPKGWKHEGGIVWKDLQACRGELVSAKWSATSPDGAITFASLPVHTWGTSSDSTMRRILEQAAEMGGCEVGGAMPAERYLREVFAPRELQGAAIVEVTANDAAVREMDQESARTKAMIAQYGGQADIENSAVVARLTWPDGTEGIALASVTSLVTTTAGQQVTTGVASERSFLRFPAARRDEAERFLATAKSSLRTNPAWKQAIDGFHARLREQQDQTHRQRMAAIDASTRAMTAAHQQRMRDIEAAGAANTARHEDRMAGMDRQMRAWESQQSSQDRMHRSFVQTIREVEDYQDGGGTVELEGGYDHAWSRGDGTYIVTDSPSFDPSRVFQDQSWKEMKKAEP